jgi:serine/threonine protein kinase
VPPDLEQLILACLAKSPADRPASAAVLKAALEVCAKATPHDPEVSTRWWRERASTLRARRKAEHRRASEKPGDPKVTMAVDLRHRSTLPVSD